jgi:hypothetical protein
MVFDQMPLNQMFAICLSSIFRGDTTQQSDTENNDIQPKGTQHTDTQRNDIHHNGTHYNNIHYNDTQHNGFNKYY